MSAECRSVLEFAYDRDVIGAIDHETVSDVRARATSLLQPKENAARVILGDENVEQAAACNCNSVDCHCPAEVTSDIDIAGGIESHTVSDIARGAAAVLRPDDIAGRVIFHQQPVIVT